jgi:superfamily II DNA/RNA helicase
MSNIATATFDSLVRDGYLVPARVFMPAPKYDFMESGIKHTVVDRYTSICLGKKAVVFAVTVGHAEAIAASFCAAGIAATTLLARHTHAERRKMFVDLDRGELKVLVTVNVMLDECQPVFDAVIIANPTNSTGKFRKQMVSAMHPRWPEGMPRADANQRRAAIAASDKPECMIIDVAENCIRHGFADL